MNGETRKALVEQVDSVINEALHSTCYSKTYAERIIGLVRKALLADRAATVTVAEPDAETVERVAQAIAYASLDPGQHPDWENVWDGNRAIFREEARAAIAAMPSAPAEDGDSWLDDALDSVHPKAVLGRMFELRLGGWEVSVTVPDGPDENGWYDYTVNEATGTGPTRKAAVLDAVAKVKAKEASGE